MKSIQLRIIFNSLSVSVRAFYHLYFLQLCDAADHDPELAAHLISNLPGIPPELSGRASELEAVMGQIRAALAA